MFPLKICKSVHLCENLQSMSMNPSQLLQAYHVGCSWLFLSSIKNIKHVNVIVKFYLQSKTYTLAGQHVNHLRLSLNFDIQHLMNMTTS